MLNLWKKATTEDSFKPEEKVRILLTEYITVPSEAIARTGHGFQIGGFVIAALSFVEAQAVNWNWKTVVILICIAIFGISGLFMVIRDLLMASMRIRDIESDVNHRAGEILLSWQTHWQPRLFGALRPPHSN